MLPRIALVVLAATLLGHAALAEPPRQRPDLVATCAPENHLCRHLRTAFGAVLARRVERGAPDGIPIWEHRIRYITAGLSPDGDELFDGLIQGLASRVDVDVERVADARSANFALLVTADPQDAINGGRFRSLTTETYGPSDRERMTAELKNGFNLIRKESDRELGRITIEHCYLAIHPGSLKERGGVRLASLIYGCLTGASRSDEVQPSLLNRTAPAVLDAPRAPKMVALDRLLLEAIYRTRFRQSGLASVDRLEAVLREQGVGDDGIKR